MASKRKYDDTHSTRREKAPRIEEIEELKHKLRLTEELLHGSTERAKILEADNSRLKKQMDSLRMDQLRFQSENQALQKQNRLLEGQLNKVITGAPSQTVKANTLDPSDTNYQYIKRVAPYESSITHKELYDEYTFVLFGIDHLASAWMAPLENDPARAAKVMANAKRNGEAAGLIKWMARVPEIATVARYDPGEDVISAILTRWVHNEIFSTRCCMINPPLERVLRRLERSIRRYMKPERDILEIRRWRQVTYSGMIAHPTYKKERETREKLMVRELEKLFGFLRPSPDYNMARELLEKVIQPAINLHERLQNGLDEVTFEFPSTHAEDGSPDNSKVVSSLLEKADAINCEDVLRNFYAFDLDKRSDQDPIRRLYPICAVSPIVVSDGDDGLGRKFTVTVCRSKIIAAWGDRTEREEKLKAVKASPFYELLD
ncbi:hypothetical protein F4776DRAFT_674174 [Hypoxylon sp. NC0597]|nr:hypothetical protein F4776DRAFT_674174 [Hypoxylon sp. NC0597]